MDEEKVKYRDKISVSGFQSKSRSNFNSNSNDGHHVFHPRDSQGGHIDSPQYVKGINSLNKADNVSDNNKQENNNARDYNPNRPYHQDKFNRQDRSDGQVGQNGNNRRLGENPNINSNSEPSDVKKTDIFNNNQVLQPNEGLNENNSLINHQPKNLGQNGASPQIESKNINKSNITPSSLGTQSTKGVPSKPVYNQKNGSEDPKKQLAKETVSNVASSYNPLLGKAVRKFSDTKLGNKIIERSMKNKPLASKLVDKMLPAGNQPTDSEGKNASEKSQENSLDKVTTIIMTPKMKIILPICLASCVVLFMVCLIFVAAQSHFSILGVDLSSQIDMDAADVQDKLMKEQNSMDAADVNNLITNSSSTSSGANNDNSGNTDGNNTSSDTNYVSNSSTSDSDGRLKKINIENGFKNTIFYYSQSDYGESYGGYGSIGSYGCGPTSLSIVISSILQQPHDPIELTNYMCNKGWCSANGAAWDQVVSVEREYAEKYGFKQKSVSDLNELRNMLKGGNALAVTIMASGGGRPNIIFNDGTGMYFEGHYFVIAGIAENGDGIVIDPSSHGGNNGKTTSLETLAENNHNSDSAPSFWVVYK